MDFLRAFMAVVALVADVQAPVEQAQNQDQEHKCFLSNSSSRIWGAGWPEAAVALVPVMQMHVEQSWSWGLKGRCLWSSWNCEA